MTKQDNWGRRRRRFITALALALALALAVAVTVTASVSNQHSSCPIHWIYHQLHRGRNREKIEREKRTQEEACVYCRLVHYMHSVHYPVGPNTGVRGRREKPPHHLLLVPSHHTPLCWRGLHTTHHFTHTTHDTTHNTQHTPHTAHCITHRTP